MTKDILEVTFRHHFQAVDAVKGINYLFGKSDIAQLSEQERERSFNTHCLLTAQEQKIWYEKPVQEINQSKAIQQQQNTTMESGHPERRTVNGVLSSNGY